MKSEIWGKNKSKMESAFLHRKELLKDGSNF